MVTCSGLINHVGTFLISSFKRIQLQEIVRGALFDMGVGSLGPIGLREAIKTGRQTMYKIENIEKH